MLGSSIVVTGPSDLRLALHGPTAACHELHAPPGSFAAALEALVRARGEGRRAFVASWITRSTCRSLVELVDLLVGHGVAGWALVWPQVHDAAGAGVARTVPRLGIAVPHALRAVDRALRRGTLPVVIAGVPSCALGPFAAQGLAVGEAELARVTRPSAHACDVRGRYPAPCEECSARVGCAGIDAWYLERFGAQELHPVAAVPRATMAEDVARGLVAAVAELEAIA